MTANPLNAIREKLARVAAERTAAQERIEAIATARPGLLKTLAEGKAGASRELVANDAEAAMLAQKLEGLTILDAETRAELAPLEEAARIEAGRVEAEREGAKRAGLCHAAMADLQTFQARHVALCLEYGRLLISLERLRCLDRAAAAGAYESLRNPRLDPEAFQAVLPGQPLPCLVVAALVKRDESPVRGPRVVHADDDRMHRMIA